LKDQVIGTTETTMFGKIVRTVVDEVNKDTSYWEAFLDENVISDENEFYVLFENGTLVKKGHTKVRSSDYGKGVKFVKFKKYYGK
jgi:hypothetical protein